MAVRKAVRAATITFTAISRILFDFISDLLNERNHNLLRLLGSAGVGDVANDFRLHLLLKDLRGQVVQLRAVGLEANTHALQTSRGGALLFVEVARRLDAGVENAQTVQLNAHARCAQLGYALGNLRQHSLDDSARHAQTVLYHVVDKTALRKVLRISTHQIPLVVSGALAVKVLLASKRELNSVSCCHN